MGVEVVNNEGVGVEEVVGSSVVLLLSSVDVDSASSVVGCGVGDVLVADDRIVLTSTLQRAMMPWPSLKTPTMLVSGTTSLPQLRYTACCSLARPSMQPWLHCGRLPNMFR